MAGRKHGMITEKYTEQREAAMDKRKKQELRKKQREREVLRQRMILGAAGAALLLILAVVIAVNAGKGEKDKPQAKGETSAGQEDGTKDGGAKDGGVLTAQSVQEPVTITVSAAGDCTLGTDENFDPATSFTAKYDEVGDPGYFLANVRDIFAADDLTIVNLEGTLTEGGERADKTFAFRGDPSYTQILTSGSVEAANLANNHSKDYGAQSYEDTISHAEAAGIRTFGYDRTALMEIKGVKVGLAGIYELADGIGCKETMQNTVSSLKSQGAQLIIVSFHWGTEKESYPDEVQRELAHAAIDAGAHLVLGHHPHVLQGVEKYNGRYICYSLGNFCFGGNKNPSDKDTMIFQQTFTIDGNEVATDDQVQEIPCSISSSSSINNYQPTPAQGSEKERIAAKIAELSQF